MPKTKSNCLCGCKQETKGGRFKPGHDARLAARLSKRALNGDERAIAKLEELGWMVGSHPISVLKTGTHS